MMPVPSTAFVYPVEEAETGNASSTVAQFERDDADFERAGRILDWVHRGIMAPGRGRGAPEAKVIALRWKVLRLILGEGSDRSLQSHALELGITRACLSKIGIRMAARLHIHAPWQRFEAREIYRARALAVHAGNHKVSDKWERRKLREAKEKKEKAEIFS